MGTLVGGGQGESVLRAPFHTLRTLRIVLALIADFSQSALWVDGDCSEIAGFDAPGAAITLGGIDVDDAGQGVLREGVARANDYTRRVLAGAAGNRGDENFINAHSADTAAVRVVLTGF